jgi:hypothetical protein
MKMQTTKAIVGAVVAMSFNTPTFMKSEAKYKDYLIAERQKAMSYQ